MMPALGRLAAVIMKSPNFVIAVESRACRVIYSYLARRWLASLVSPGRTGTGRCASARPIHRSASGLGASYGRCERRRRRSFRDLDGA